ncbi:hypothetical protein R1T16_00515 [Flavobacterium sp. DG1-102-2]|uniref:hypothetical protein n=1 Tax=Flavobacterium sp. DG1-102-2 TaxID=3081663 RepID=UPI0029491304|nr:hypothetical protein [Flavobacterium sp. DG1-102-2]MDV6166887.1 hypothetical protein [Flavobacterium sp. DG1-102-2]
MSKEDTTIKLPDAVRYAARWRKVEGHYNKHHELHAFVIPKNDFIGILTEEIDAVRGYLGVDDNGEEKLMFVGTKYNKETNTYVDMLPAPGNNNQIYDLTMPCPNACDQRSILNTLLLEEK